MALTIAQRFAVSVVHKSSWVGKVIKQPCASPRNAAFIRSRVVSSSDTSMVTVVIVASQVGHIGPEIIDQLIERGEVVGDFTGVKVLVVALACPMDRGAPRPLTTNRQARP